MAYSGSCHCGNIKYTVDADIDALIECNCSICSKRGYLLFFVPQSKFDLQAVDSEPQTYTFNRHQIKHRFCPSCGVAPFGEGADSEGNTMVAINARTLDDTDLSQFTINPYDGKSL